jgi:hypothetical protein
VFNSFQTKLTVFFTALFLLLQGAAFFTVRESIVQNIFDQSRDQLVAANRVFASRIQATVNALGRLSLLYYDLNQENGDAWTAAYVLRSFRKQRLTLEVLHADSKRPEREFLNLPVRAKETTIQASYRFFL